MLPVFDLSRIIEFSAKQALDLVKWLALRALLLGCILTLVPIAIYKGWALISEKLFTYLGSTMNTADIWDGTMIELTGLAAWVGTNLRFSECFSVLASAAMFKFTLSLIKR